MRYHKLTYRVIPDKEIIDVWRVEAHDEESEGECYVTIFSGPYAEIRAKEYLALVDKS